MDILPPLQQLHPQEQSLNLDNINALKILGKGSMGTVFLVHHTTTDPSARFPFALKVADKTSLHSKHDADRRARWEIKVLTRLSHPFLPKLMGFFETKDLLAWAVPYCPGGDLNVLRYRQNDRVFSPAVIRFYLSEIICALEYLHNMGIAYRDLKPENVLVQQSGHVTLTDFDLSRNLAKKTINSTTTLEKRSHKVPVPEISKKHRRALTRWIQAFNDNKNGLMRAKSARVSPVSRKKPSSDNGERSNSFVGTEEYVSPEVVRGDGHEFAVDWWALGILTYEMLYGTTPFKGNNRKETFRNVLMKSPECLGKRTDLMDLIERLLEKDPMKRLGYERGACEIKEHVFFKGIKWDLLTDVLRPPFIPSREDCQLTEKVTGGGQVINIREYFQNLRAPPPSMPPSPIPSSSPGQCQGKASFTEY
ncbi:serine/threonine-protein kinase UCNL-like [Mangifera indica]|uniref:serine/threonine-protein kinase UCNL-like n=1 Tax=Mangifera indica TaxID=29780 RepID=UPI001CFB4EBB|nr:serine/threonine-protein kinase UCNL-like [Mangifera indica]